MGETEIEAVCDPLKEPDTDFETIKLVVGDLELDGVVDLVRDGVADSDLVRDGVADSDGVIERDWELANIARMPSRAARSDVILN